MTKFLNLQNLIFLFIVKYSILLLDIKNTDTQLYSVNSLNINKNT